MSFLQTDSLASLLHIPPSSFMFPPATDTDDKLHFAINTTCRFNSVHTAVEDYVNSVCAIDQDAEMFTLLVVVEKNTDFAFNWMNKVRLSILRQDDRSYSDDFGNNRQDVITLCEKYAIWIQYRGTEQSIDDFSKALCAPRE